AQVTNWVKLKFAAMNLKKLARWKWNARVLSVRSFLFLSIYAQNPAAACCAAGFFDRLEHAAFAACSNKSRQNSQK
ncbi:MAG: hypothetical protein VB096_07475, partial [Pseudoflavonifractor sp.]|nr:hypothetical protein [Pseudoflavonifractor sp.]